MDEVYILSIDQGTTSTRIAVIDSKLNIVAIEQMDHDQIHSNPGWTEHDPMQIFFNIRLLIDRIIHRHSKLIPHIKTIGITNQRETCLCWDTKTGDHLSNAIVWHDTRTVTIVEDTIKRNNNDVNAFRKIVGLPINTYFSAVKIKWIIENADLVKERFEKNDIENVAFGTIDSWIVYKLTGNFFTDVTNASRTFLMNLETLDWDDNMLKEFNIPRQCLPKILSSTDDFGKINYGLKNIHITGVIGDQQSACMGHILDVGEVKNTYGTGCFILMNTGEKIVQSTHGLLTTVLYKDSKKTLYALEGAIETAGSSIEWLKNNMKLIDSFDDLKTLYHSVEDSGGVVFVPAFSGLFSPHWDNSARGLIIGLTSYTSKGHIVRAIFEAICLRTNEVVKCFEKDSGMAVIKLKVDGGMTSNDDFLQIQSDVLQLNVEKQKEKEITIIGSAIVAGLYSIWKDTNELKELVTYNHVFNAQWTKEKLDAKLIKWEKAVERSKDWI